MVSTAKIEVRKGFEVVTEHFFCLKSKILVGRSVGVDIQIKAQEVSRRHALLIPQSQGVEVQDLSRNGVLFKGRKIAGKELLPYEATLEIGSFSLLISLEDGEAPDSDLIEMRRRILSQLIDHVDLNVVDQSDKELRPRVEAALERIASTENVPPETEIPRLVTDLADEALGLGPLEQLLVNDGISEIMVVGPRIVFVERNGQLEQTDLKFSSEEAVRTIIDRIITPLGRRIDESSPMVDARLPNGSRVNAVIPPLAICGPTITIRKFSKASLTIEKLVDWGAMDPAMSAFLKQAVIARANIVISGGTGSGKTTLLGALAKAIPENERIITVEDAAELNLSQSHVVSLESRPPNAEGKGHVTIRDLVRNALRMRPDRIIVGECRGGEALDMLQAMNTGHDGSLTTLHANSPAEAVSRLETLCLMAGVDLPSRAIREQIGGAVDVIVQQTRLQEGFRKITSISEVCGIEKDGHIRLNEIFRYKRSQGKTDGEFVATGWLSSLVIDDESRDLPECLVTL